MLYGTTYFGGKSKGFCCGAFYSLSPGGTYTVRYRFGQGDDGIQPEGNFVEMQGALYDVTPLGGAFRKGTVYSITLSGQERVLHSFGGPLDGTNPDAMTHLRGTLYGTTDTGGAVRQRCAQSGNGCGTIFSLVP